MLATNHRTCRCGNAGPVGPLSWSDIREIQDDYGIRPTASPPTSPSPEAEVLLARYHDWVYREGINQSRRYVMPLCSLYVALAQDYGDLWQRHEAARTAQRLLVDGLNDEDNGLEVVLCPSRVLRRGKRRS